MKVTGWPLTVGEPVLVSTVLVGALFTTCCFVAALLAMKFASPE